MNNTQPKLVSLKVLLAAIVLTVIGQLAAVASQTVTIAWDASNDFNVVGFRLYYGTASGVYTNSVDVGNVTNATVTLPDDSATYYVAVTTYDADGNQSGYSNEATVSPVAAATATVSTTPAEAISHAGFNPNGHFSFNVGGTTGAQYVVEATTDLIHWTPVQTNSAPFAFEDSSSSVYSKRFYRAVAL